MRLVIEALQARSQQQSPARTATSHRPVTPASAQRVRPPATSRPVRAAGGTALRAPVKQVPQPKFRFRCVAMLGNHGTARESAKARKGLCRRLRRLHERRADEWLNRVAAGVLLLSLPALACVMAGP